MLGSAGVADENSAVATRFENAVNLSDAQLELTKKSRQVGDTREVGGIFTI